MSELTPPQQRKKQANLKQYTTHKNTYKMAYIFKTYPYIQQNNSVEIAEYLRTHDEQLTDDFIIFLRTFITPSPRPTTYNIKNRERRLPKALQSILNNTIKS